MGSLPAGGVQQASAAAQVLAATTAGSKPAANERARALAKGERPNANRATRRDGKLAEEDSVEIEHVEAAEATRASANEDDQNARRDPKRQQHPKSSGGSLDVSG